MSQDMPALLRLPARFFEELSDDVGGGPARRLCCKIDHDAVQRRPRRWLECDSPRLHFASRCDRERTRAYSRWNRVVRPVVVALVRFQTDKDRMRRVSPLTLSGMLVLVACSSEPIGPPAPLNFIVVSAGGFKACGVAQG